jgi:hypothetical protein
LGSAIRQLNTATHSVSASVQRRELIWPVKQHKDDFKAAQHGGAQLQVLLQAGKVNTAAHNREQLKEECKAIQYCGSAWHGSASGSPAGQASEHGSTQKSRHTQIKPH